MHKNGAHGPVPGGTNKNSIHGKFEMFQKCWSFIRRSMTNNGPVSDCPVLICERTIAVVPQTTPLRTLRLHSTMTFMVKAVLVLSIVLSLAWSGFLALWFKQNIFSVYLDSLNFDTFDASHWAFFTIQFAPFAVLLFILGLRIRQWFSVH